MYIKVENETLVRDMQSNAILETDRSKLQRHRSIRRSLRSKTDQIAEMQEKLNKLEELIGKLTNADNIQT